MDVRDLVWAYQTYYSVDVAQELEGADVIDLLRCAGCDLRFFDPPFAGTEALYIALQEHAFFYADTKPEYEVAQRHLPASGRVLDIGCGRGAFARMVPEGVEYVGLELNTSAASQARSSGLDVMEESLSAHAERLAETYDAIVTFQVLEHVNDVRGFLDDCCRALRARGTLCVAVPSADGFMGAVTNNVLNLPPHHLSWWTDRCLANIANLCGLRLVGLEHDPLQPDHFGTYLNHMALSAIGVHGNPPRLIDRRRHVVFAERVCSRLTRRLARPLADPRLRPRGHSVTAIYEKP